VVNCRERERELLLRRELKMEIGKIEISLSSAGINVQWLVNLENLLAFSVALTLMIHILSHHAVCECEQTSSSDATLMILSKMGSRVSNSNFYYI
jgi:hypothetical protein